MNRTEVLVIIFIASFTTTALMSMYKTPARTRTRTRTNSLHWVTNIVVSNLRKAAAADDMTVSSGKELIDLVSSPFSMIFLPKGYDNFTIPESYDESVSIRDNVSSRQNIQFSITVDSTAKEHSRFFLQYKARNKNNSQVTLDLFTKCALSERENNKLILSIDVPVNTFEQIFRNNSY